MNSDKIKRMLDACYLAKRIRELLPELPEGVTPAYIQYMDVIHNRQKECPDVKVSDISDALKLPRPGVTRTVKEMEKRDTFINMHPKKTAESRILRLRKKARNCPRSMIKIITADFQNIWTIFQRKKQTA